MEQLVSFLKQNNIAYTNIEAIAQSGGDRKYFRVYTKTNSLIAAIGNLVSESIPFFSFTETFQKLNLPVPEIIAVSEDKLIYIQQDFGQICLLDLVLQDGHSENVLLLYKKALAALAKLQILGHANIDYTKCITAQQFDATAANNDLLYCLEHFVSQLDLNFHQEKLLKQFNNFSQAIGKGDYNYFMYRDFQGRNIMVQNNEVFFIDYQGGMKGPLQYDVASLLWQAKAQLPMQWKDELLEFYIQEVEKYIPINDKNVFKNQYTKIVLVRLLQVLGAYGRRGLKEGKAHFISSIPSGINNVEMWLQNYHLEENYSEINNLLEQIIAQKKKFN